jgi:RNA polymerase sigma factor (sigma-70 family)
MQPLDDSQLLRQYSETGSDEAFAALVRQHVNLVYSVALRHVDQPHQAEEVAHAVFIILAKKAKAVRDEKALSSWLFQTTRLTALNFMRSEVRRHFREHATYMQSVLNESSEVVWDKIAPVVDAIVATLGEKERRALVLRFYEGKSLREVGAALGVSDDTAEKRVTRALEKLRRSLSARGISSTAAVLSETILEHSVRAAPPALATSITTVALTKGATASSSTYTAVKGALNIMAWTKMKIAAFVGAGVLLAVVGATDVYKGSFFGRHKPVAVLPRSSWAFKGYATPEAAIESRVWAKSTGNVKEFFAVSKPEMVREVAGMLFKNTKTDQERSQALVESIKRISAVRIEKKTVLPDGQVVLELRFDGLPHDGYETITMTNMGGQWSAVIDEGHFGEGYLRFPALAKNEFARRAGSALQGSWTGEIKAGKGSLHFNVNIAEQSAGNFRADFYCVEGGGVRNATQVTYDGITVKLAPFGPRNGVFQGALSKDNTQIIGQWRKGERVVPMTFARAN